MRTKRTWSIVAVVMLGLTVPALAGSLDFMQTDWLDGAGGYKSQDSDWGRVEITLISQDAGDFYLMTAGGVSGYGGFINIATDVGGAGPVWNVMNLPIFFEDAAELDGRLPQGVAFDLGVAPGTDVTSLDYTWEIIETPTDVMPAWTPTTVSVGTFEFLAGGDALWMGTILSEGAGPNAPAPAENFTGANKGEKIGSVAKVTVAEKDLPTVNEDKNGCAPGSVARSVKYMSNTHSNVNVPDSAQTVYGQMRTAMDTDANGTSTADILSGKNSYVSANNLPIVSTQSNSFAKAMDTLKNGGDVEVGVSWGKDADGNSLGAHRAMVTEMQEITDSAGNTTGYVVKIVDDPEQGDGKAENKVHTLKFDKNGKLIGHDGKGAATGAGLINFQTEDVVASKVTIEFPWFTVVNVRVSPQGEVEIPTPFGGTTVTIPVKRKGETTRIGGIRITYEGAQNVTNPVQQIDSFMDVSLGEAGDADTISMALGVEEFEPLDPTIPTIIHAGLSLRNVLAMDENVNGTLLPMVEGSEPEFVLENLVTTSTFFDITYMVEMPGEQPQIFRLHGEIPENLEGKAWLLDMDPDYWVESFFDVFFDIEMTDEAFGEFHSPLTLLNLDLHGEQIPEPATLALLALGCASLIRRRRR